MESCTDRFQSLYFSFMWWGIFPRSSDVVLSLVPGAPASLLRIVFASLVSGVVIIIFKSLVEGRLEGMGKEKWWTQRSKTVRCSMRKSHFTQA